MTMNFNQFSIKIGKIYKILIQNIVLSKKETFRV